MSDVLSSSDSDESDSPESKLRISLVLSPYVRSQSQSESLELPTEPIAVPASVRKRGLSAVVNHLLDRKVPKEDDGSSSSSDEDGSEKLPAIPFDFLLNDKLLRLPLESAARKEGLSTENALELQYFPARVPPRKEGESESLPDWITCMEYNHCGVIDGGKGSISRLFTGGADGFIRSFFSSSKGDGDLQQATSVSAHTGPIKCIATFSIDSTALVATGSTDQTLITHLHGNENTMDLHAAYSGGHTNSIGSVALTRHNSRGGKVIMASGDWDGGLAIWSVPSDDGGDMDGDTATHNISKKRKGSKGGFNKPNDSNVGIREVKPLQSIKAHASNISGLAWGYNGHDKSSSAPTTLLTGSWDHGLKVYDTTRLDCILALNGACVVTSLSRCSNSDIVATASPDCTVRLWDMRTSGEGKGSGGNGTGMDKSLRQSHKAWVSGVQWSPTDPFVLASTSHDGTLKVWDIRSSLPLHTIKAVNQKGEKALCLTFGDGIIYSGGSDCVVKQFACII